jgi:hypothetical protein
MRSVFFALLTVHFLFFRNFHALTNLRQRAELTQKSGGKSF